MPRGSARSHEALPLFLTFLLIEPFPILAIMMMLEFPKVDFIKEIIMSNHRIQFIEYKGKRILLEDFSNVKSDDELEPLVWEAEKIVHQQPLGSLLVVVDLTNSHFGPKTSQASKAVAKGNAPYIKASSLVGMNKLMEVIYNSLRVVTGRKIVSFSTREEAYEWLIEQ